MFEELEVRCYKVSAPQTGPVERREIDAVVFGLAFVALRRVGSPAAFSKAIISPISRRSGLATQNRPNLERTVHT
jgi:hypothetical protein